MRKRQYMKIEGEIKVGGYKGKITSLYLGSLSPVISEAPKEPLPEDSKVSSIAGPFAGAGAATGSTVENRFELVF